MHRIFVSRRLSIDPAAFLRAQGRDVKVIVHDSDEACPRDALLAGARDADGLVAMISDKIDAPLLAACPRLRAVGNHAVGIDNIDVPACTARGVTVTNTPDVLTESTADLTWTLLLAVARRVREGEKLLREGRFRGWTPTMLLGLELHGATLGIIGFGRIGQAVARRAAGFGMRVVCSARSEEARAAARVLGAEAVPLETLLAASQVVSLHCPLNAATHHLLDAARLALLPRGAILLNTARGPVVDEAALVAALERGHLAGAGLDVFEREPAVHPGLLGRDDVVLLPHLGSATGATRARMAQLALADVARVLDQEPPRHPVNPTR